MNIRTMIPPHLSSLQHALPFTLPPADLQDLLNAPPIDVRLLLEQCLGKPLFAVSLLEEFARTGQDRVEEMEAQAAHGNLDALAERAHSLRGVAGILGASALMEVTIHMEAAAREENLAHTRTLVPQLRHEMHRVLDHIPHFCAQARQQHKDVLAGQKSSEASPQTNG